MWMNNENRSLSGEVTGKSSDLLTYLLNTVFWFTAADGPLLRHAVEKEIADVT